MDITAPPSWLFVEYDHHGWWKCGYCRSKISARPSLDIRRTAIPGSLRHTAQSMDITALPSWLFAEYRPSMDIKKGAPGYGLGRLFSTASGKKSN